MRKIAFILLIAMLFSFAVSCTTEQIENSDTSEIVSGESSVGTSDDVSGEASLPEDDNKVVDPQYATVVSLGKSYSKSFEASADSYPDSNNMELTDSIAAPEVGSKYSEELYSGYLKAKVMSVDIELGSIGKRLYEFKCGYLVSKSVGIEAPDTVNVYYSNDGSDYVLLGECEKPESVDGSRLEAVYRSDVYIEASYIRFEFIYEGAWLFLDELYVIADVEGSDGNKQYAESINKAYEQLGVVKFEGGAEPDKSLALELVSKGSKYTSSVELNDKNASGFLTDGIISSNFGSGRFATYEGKQQVSFVIDLGKKREDLSIFKAYCYSNNAIGINFPVAVTYSVGNTKDEFVDIGRVYSVPSGQSYYNYTLALDKCATGRYVRVTFEATESNVIFVEELAVYAYTGKATATGLYPEVKLDTNPKEHKNPTDENVNLIKGLKQQIGCITEVAEKENNTVAGRMILTDGKHATSNDIHNGQFFKFYNGGYRDIYFDFGGISALNKVTAEFTYRLSWGVTASHVVEVKLSEDGVNWYEAARIDVEPESSDEIVLVEHTFETPVKARYICYRVYVEMWLGISELEAFGTTAVGNAVALANSGFKLLNAEGKGYNAPKSEILDGSSDLMLLYHSAKFSFTAQELIPYLAYVDSDGQIKDTMFDSFLFLLSGNPPSGKGISEKANKEDWQWMLDDLFANGENILALEEAAGTVKKALKLSDDYKFPFTVALYHPGGVTDFGDVDGDGVNEDVTKFEGQLKVIKWYMDEIEKRVSSYNFQNIKLGGYYWYSESVSMSTGARQLVKAVSEEVHGRDFDFIWIPWFVSPGYNEWDSFGFDVACMQPNYVFEEQQPYSRIEQTAYWARYYGMGIEIEMSYDSLYNELNYNRYLEYLAGGVKYGYMKNCIHMYYQDITALYTAAISSNEKVRKLYDYTYQFIKGTLQAYPEAVEKLTVNSKTNEVFTGNLFDNASEDMIFDITQSPSHGIVSIDCNGNFTYYPEEGYTGTVSFGYSFDYGLGASDECIVEIIIG